MKKGLLIASLAAAGVLAPVAAFAHTGAGETAGLVHGFMHPLGGLDHILAMVAVGMFAVCLGGRAVWLVPASFVVMMAFGGLLGVQGVAVPFVETGIAASVIVLGLAVALRLTVPVAAAMGLVGVFAIFHGFAHGAEMPVDASGLSYAMGFMLATALLHVAGVAAGFGIGRYGARSALMLRASGGAMATAGVAILAGLI